MQYVGRYYVPYINHTYDRTGILWEGRYKSNLIDEEAYLLSCMPYLELNPVRANMVENPRGYAWTSYHANVEGETNRFLTLYALYLQLGLTSSERRLAYRNLFKVHVEAETVREIRDTWQASQSGKRALTPFRGLRP